jgi:hypothetical protein
MVKPPELAAGRAGAALGIVAAKFARIKYKPYKVTA